MRSEYPRLHVVLDARLERPVDYELARRGLNVWRWRLHRRVESLLGARVWRPLNGDLRMHVRALLSRPAAGR